MASIQFLFWELCSKKTSISNVHAQNNATSLHKISCHICYSTNKGRRENACNVMKTHNTTILGAWKFLSLWQGAENSAATRAKHKVPPRKLGIYIWEPYNLQNKITHRWNQQRNTQRTAFLLLDGVAFLGVELAFAELVCFLSLSCKTMADAQVIF